MFITRNLSRFISKSPFSGYVHQSSFSIKPLRTFSSTIINKFDQQQNSSSEWKYTPVGQPTSYTHPHLLANDEVIVGITKNELNSRRIRLMENIQEYAVNLEKNLKNHIIVIPSAQKKYMSDKIPYVFRQNTDFLYLAGCLEPDSILVLTIDESRNVKSIIFVRPKDKHAEMWDGARTGVENAPFVYGVDEAYSIKEFSSFLTKYSSNNLPYIFWYDQKNSDQPDINDTIQEFINNSKSKTAEPPTTFIHKLRVIKSQAEIFLMQKTCDIASKAINQTIMDSKPGDSEHHLFARVDYHSRMLNANFLAYPPVVASGSNATTIHYISNSQIIKNEDLVLMDAGCEYGGYTSDITRTWPISGNFTNPQRILYEMVLALQKDLIDVLLKDGGQTLDELFDTMCLKLGKYLQEIGLIGWKMTGLGLAKAAYNFCPHHVSHYLGMDVHDTPLISRSSKLVPGMVFTIEPGIYINANRKDVPEEFRGMGIRIEDDVVVNNDNSIEILTKNCFKEINDLEKVTKHMR